jgi:GT2 family glycosyltransferase
MVDRISRMNSTNPINAINPKSMLSIVIITKDTKELLEQLLRSIEKDGSLRSSLKEIIIIDNASVDGTGDMIHNEFPWTIYVRNDRNMGFAASANQGIDRSNGKYALLLNSDTVLIEGETAKMLAFMEEHEEVGICGPQLVYPDMRPQRSSASIPSLLTELLPFRGQPSADSHQHTASNSDNRSSIIDETSSPPHASRLTPHEPSSSQLSALSSPLAALDVPSLIGAAMMIRKSLFQELSGFDEQFFFFLEETDLCLRAAHPPPASRQRSAISDQQTADSYQPSAIIDEASSPPSALSSPLSALRPTVSNRVVFLPDVKVIHLQGKTVGKNWIKGRIEYNISLYKFIKKHHSAPYYRSFQAVRFLKSFIVILVLSLLPFLLIGKRVRRRYVYYWKVLLWHLAACPPTAGLQTPV